jgi:hypothetical protein
MSPSSDEVAAPPQSGAAPDPAPQPQVNKVNEVNEVNQAKTDPTAPSTQAAEPSRAEAPVPTDPPPPGFLMYTVFGFLCLGVVVWLLFAWTGYKEKYSQITEGWHLGGTKMIEITLIRDDRKNLACASDKTFGPVRCGYHLNGQPAGASAAEDPNVLQPFNTIKNELFLAAGLWQSPILIGTLPAERFTVVCNYHVVGVLKAVSLRWSPTGNFNPVDQSVAVGTLSDCVVPQ